MKCLIVFCVLSNAAAAAVWCDVANVVYVIQPFTLTFSPCFISAQPLEYPELNELSLLSILYADRAHA